MKISTRTIKARINLLESEPAKKRRGFVLVEIIVAMVLLAIALSSLAALMYSVSQQGMVASANAYRNGVLMEQVNKYEGQPYASIPVGKDSVMVSTGPYQYSRVVTVTEPLVATTKTVVVIVKPTNPRYKPDTATFLRTNARVPLTLCTTCAAN